MRARYALHPGWVTSKNDGDLHFIGAAALARLYQLRPHEYIIWNYKQNGRDWYDYVHLYPDYNGRYGRPQQ